MKPASKWPGDHIPILRGGSLLLADCGLVYLAINTNDGAVVVVADLGEAAEGDPDTVAALAAEGAALGAVVDASSNL
jgi:hypothetical protein